MASSKATARADATHMARCLALAEAHRGRVSPNPLVGCVIVDARGVVIGEGAHAGPGQAHAEVAALAGLEEGAAKGGTLYVSLEPCNHHGRTPPCAPAVVASGVARVVIAGLDPVAGHGGGADVLRAAGIEVAVGVMEREARAMNRPFFTWGERGRAHFVLKAAVTLDGKIATVGGESKWITGEAARADVMALRDRCDAVLVGIGTVLADDPQLTARFEGARNPVRVVVDSGLRVPDGAAVLGDAARTIVACAEDAPARTVAGAEVWRLPRDARGRVSLGELAKRLAAAGLIDVLVEGGGEVHAALLADDLADELVLYIAPTVVGGAAKSWVGGAGVGALADAWGFAFTGAPTLVGRDLRLHALRAR